MPLATLPRSSRSRKRPEPIIIDRFQGANTAFSETRIGRDFAKECINFMLVEDGIWQTRWGTKAYGGVSFTADPDGGFEYTKTDGTRELIAIADGFCWRIDPLSSTKTKITTTPFTQGKRAYFLQVSNLLYIGNGTDPLARYDGTTITTYSGLTTPTGVGLTRGAGLSAGSYAYIYRVSAVNAVGETLSSAEVTILVNKLRDSWVAASNEYIDVAWTAVPGALRYIIYCDDTPGYGQKVTEVATNSFRDDGGQQWNPYLQPPISDTTTGPRLGPMCLSNNQIWGLEGPDGSNPWTLYFSGSGANLGNFSAAFGGGWIRLEFGSKNRLQQVIDFQGRPTALASTPDGSGSVWVATLGSQTIGDTTFTVPTAQKIIGGTGTESPGTVVLVENDFMMLNRLKVAIVGNEPGVLNVLRLNEISRYIRNRIRAWTPSGLKYCCAFYTDQKVFFSSPIDDETWVFDRELKQWYGPWTIGFRQFLNFTDSGGNVHILGIRNHQFVELSEGYLGDEGVAFLQRWTSPRIQVSKDFSLFAKIKRVLVRLRASRGTIGMSVVGTGKSGSLSTVLSTDISPGSGTSGIGWDLMGDFLMGDSEGLPSTFSDESQIKERRVNKLMRDIQFTIQGNTIDTFISITGIKAEPSSIKRKSPPSWRS